MLVSYAVKAEKSKGRIFQEPLGFNSIFEEDRQRILLSSAFKRLGSKMQVLEVKSNDHIQRRLTHSLAVACVAKTLAIQLNLNRELADTVALAHDLGHPPFGHTGEDVLDNIMKGYGKVFYHNTHTFKIVTILERRSIDFPGLNLSKECLEGILKHNGPLIKEGQKLPEKYAYIQEYIDQTGHDLQLSKYSTLEAQVAAIADDIAYLNHDIEDSFGKGIITLEQLKSIDIIRGFIEEKEHRYAEEDHDQLIGEVLRSSSAFFIDDAIKQTRKNLEEHGIETLEQIYDADKAMCEFSPELKVYEKQLRDFTTSQIFPKAKQGLLEKVEILINEVFAYIMENPKILPMSPWQKRFFASTGDAQRAEVVCDFVAGMSDNFLMDYHFRISNKNLFL